jgi:signal transduction histidine kinase
MDADAREMAKFIADGAARMSTLVDDLLSFARTGAPGPFGNINLQHAVRQAMQNLAPAVEASGGLVTVDWLPIVPGIESYLVRLFQNLIGNALKYRNENSPEIYVSAARLGLGWVVKVRDNGLGIAEKNQTRIFLPFTRLANRDVPGSGLGLAVCKKIVEELGGAIWVESELGTGSTFCFTIAAKD